jgi:hypothetical protein
MFSALNNGKNAASGKRFMYPAVGIYGIVPCVALFSTWFFEELFCYGQYFYNLIQPLLYPYF